MVKIFFCFVFFFIYEASTRDFNYFYQSSKALMMGDAYTTLADGMSTLFYNPALAARNNLFSLELITVDIQSFDILDKRDMISELDTEDIAHFADQVIGEPLFAAAYSLPTLQFSWLTLTRFDLAKGHAIVRDRVHPVIDINYKQDSGFAVGFGYIFYGNPKKKDSLAAGISLKKIRRGSISSQYDVFGTRFADLISSGANSYEDFRDNLGYSKGSGVGFDLGIDWRYQTSRNVVAMGFSAMDVLDTKIKVDQGAGPIPSQDMLIRAGGSFSHKFSFLADVTMSFDIHPIKKSMNLRDKVHAGFRLGLPLFDFYAGSNGGLFSYGIVCDLYLLELGVGYYDVDVAGMKEDRLMAYVSLLDFEF